MIGEDYISYETARLLKNKGFDELCYACYEYFSSNVTMYSGWPFEYKGEPVHNTNDRVKCPTLQMAMKWLREACAIEISVACFNLDRYRYDIYEINSSNFSRRTIEFNSDDFISYEGACEAAIKYCLTNLI